MKAKMLPIAGATAIAALAGALILYAAHPVRGSDHQDSPTVVNRPAADITDVFVYQAPDNANNVVLQMDVWPLITHSMLGMTALDPSVMYQFKIDNTGDGVEDLVVQLQPNASGISQTINVFGPAKPNVTGTASSFVAQTGSIPFNQGGSISAFANGVKAFVGPTKDPFFFDLLQFFNIIPDRYYGCHGFPNAFNVPCGGATAASFNGFTAGFNTTHATSCIVATPSSDALSAHQFNVIAIVVEMPKSLLLNPTHPVIGVWATTSTVSGT